MILRPSGENLGLSSSTVEQIRHLDKRKGDEVSGLTRSYCQMFESPNCSLNASRLPRRAIAGNSVGGED
jgi:hypothetical protein